jgi:hypothetical protein
MRIARINVRRYFPKPDFGFAFSGAGTQLRSVEINSFIEVTRSTISRSFAIQSRVLHCNRGLAARQKAMRGRCLMSHCAEERDPFFHLRLHKMETHRR